MVTQLTAQDYDGHWLLDFTIEGQRYSYTSAPNAVTVNEADGTARLYVVGLADLQASRTSSTATVSLEAQVDWAALAAGGANLEGGTARLRRWFEGLTINEAVDYAVGTVTGVQYGELAEPLSFGIESAGEARTGLLLPLGARSSNSMQASPYQPYEQTVGAPFPIVVGFPGEWPSGKGGPSDGRWPCVPIILTDVIIPGTSLNDAARCVVSLRSITAVSLRVRAVGAKISPAFQPENLDAIRTPVSGHIPAHDGRVEYSLPVSFFDFSGTLVDGSTLATTMLPYVQESKVEFYAGFKASTGGGIGNIYGTGTLSGAGDVILWALRTAPGDLLVDFEQLEALAPRLAGYRIDTYINDPEVTALEWLEGAVLPHLPVIKTTTPRGWSLAYVDYGANEKDAIATLVAGRDVDRASAVQLASDGVANQVTVSYRPKDGARNYASQVTVTPNVFVAGSNTAGDIRHPSYPSKIASASESRYGLRAVDIEVAETWDDATALLIAQDAIKARALPVTNIAYQALSYEWERTQVGDVYLLTDAGLSLSERVAIVTDVQVGGGQPPVITLMLPDPMLKRPTGG